MSKRKAHYCVRIAKAVCQEIALGSGVKRALEKVGPLAPTVATFWRWLEEYPEFRERYDRACQMQASMHADRILELAETALATPNMASAVRVAMDIYKWNAEMRDPAKFSPKAPQEHKAPPKTVQEMRNEIKRLEDELGVNAQPGMVTAKRQPAEGGTPAPAPNPVPNLKVVGDE